MNARTFGTAECPTRRRCYRSFGQLITTLGTDSPASECDPYPIPKGYREPGCATLKNLRSYCH